MANLMNKKKLMELMPIPEREATSWGIENQPIIYCPTPRHVNQHSLFFKSLDQSGANLNRGGDQLETDLILSQDGAEANSVFFCESPPRLSVKNRGLKQDPLVFHAGLPLPMQAAQS
ncbi:uncharacterized protein LOC144565573 isoform X3 [Carex rostrata]